MIQRKTTQEMVHVLNTGRTRGFCVALSLDIFCKINYKIKVQITF